MGYCVVTGELVDYRGLSDGIGLAGLREKSFQAAESVEQDQTARMCSLILIYSQ